MRVQAKRVTKLGSIKGVAKRAYLSHALGRSADWRRQDTQSETYVLLLFERSKAESLENNPSEEDKTAF